MGFQEFADSPARLGTLGVLPGNSPETPLPIPVVLLGAASEVLLTSSSFGPTHPRTVPPSGWGGNG